MTDQDLAYDSDFDQESLRELGLNFLYNPSTDGSVIDEELLKHVKKNEESISKEKDNLSKNLSTEFEYGFALYEYAYLLSSIGLYNEAKDKYEEALSCLDKYYPEYEVEDSEDIKDEENKKEEEDKIQQRILEKKKIYDKSFNQITLQTKESFLLIYYKIVWKYTMLIDFLNENNQKIERLFQKLSKIQFFGVHLGDYAFFCYKKIKNFKKSCKLYDKILAVHPFMTSIRIKYATYLRYYARDLKKCEEQYKIGLESDGRNKELLGIYASFLYSVHRNLDEAEKYYKLSVDFEESPNNSSSESSATTLYDSISTQPSYNLNNLCNYGLFLSEERRNFEESEKLYIKILLINPNHINTLYNYSVLLDTCLKNKKKSKLLYNLTLKNDPKHSYALYNYAVLLEEQYFVYNPLSFYDKTGGVLLNVQYKDNEKKLKKVLNYYKRAYESDPKDTMTMADYGRFLYISTGSHEKASPFLYNALQKDDMCCTAYVYLSMILFRELNKYTEAENILKTLVSKCPTYNLGNLALQTLLQFKK